MKKWITVVTYNKVFGAPDSLIKTAILFFLFSCAVQAQATLNSPAIPVFSSGQDGYACFRIPAILHLNNGDLLAFAEGRKKGCSDTGDIDLVMKRSTDHGASWGPLQILWDDKDNSCGNPAPVVDARTGHIVLLSTWNLGEDREPQIIDQTSKDTRRVFMLRSQDQGLSWSRPREITKKVKQADWTWYATGPGSGMQVQNGPHTGRMLIGCDHIEAGTKKYFSHVIYSDNGGRRWKLGGSSPKDQVNECEVAELSNGRLMMNMRNYDRNQRSRQTMISTDGGASWSQQKHHPELIEPICQGSLHRHGNLLLFSNPASSEKREKMTLKISENDGLSWPMSLLLHAGPAAYSDLVSITEQKLGCFFEAGTKSPYEQLVFQLIELQPVGKANK